MLKTAGKKVHLEDTNYNLSINIPIAVHSLNTLPVIQNERFLNQLCKSFLDSDSERLCQPHIILYIIFFVSPDCRLNSQGSRPSQGY